MLWSRCLLCLLCLGRLEQKPLSQDGPQGFEKLQLRVAKIISVEKHPNASKLYIEQIDFGDEKRQIVSGLVPYYSEDELLGKKIIVVTNLESANLRGVDSDGMLLAAEENGVVELIATDADIGEYVFTDTTKADLRLIKSLAKINIKDFSKISLYVKNKIAYCDEHELKTIKDFLHTSKVSNGLIR